MFWDYIGCLLVIEVHRPQSVEEVTSDLMKRFSVIERTVECMELTERERQRPKHEEEAV